MLLCPGLQLSLLFLDSLKIHHSGLLAEPRLRFCIQVGIWLRCCDEPNLSTKIRGEAIDERGAPACFRADVDVSRYCLPGYFRVLER